MSRILVTGATGLLGKALVRSLVQSGHAVVAAVRNLEKAQRIFAGLGGVELVRWDVLEKAPEGLTAEGIVHAAAETSSRGFVERPVETIGTILEGTRNVLEFARKTSAQSVVFLSTMEIYGAPTADPVTEADYGYLDPVAVRSSYPEAKRLAENLCVSYSREYGVPVKIARLTQTFGPGVAYDDGRVFAEFARAVIERRDIVLKTAGRTARCYCHIDDAVSAITTLLGKGVAGEAYNVANPQTFCTIREMADRLAERHPATHVVLDETDAAARGFAPEFRMRLSTAKLEALGWRPVHDLDAMFADLIADMRAQAPRG